MGQAKRAKINPAGVGETCGARREETLRDFITRETESGFPVKKKNKRIRLGLYYPTHKRALIEARGWILADEGFVKCRGFMGRVAKGKLLIRETASEFEGLGAKESEGKIPREE